MTLRWLRIQHRFHPMPRSGLFVGVGEVEEGGFAERLAEELQADG